MLEHDFRSDLGYWAHRAAHRFERAMNAEVAAEGLTYRQCQILAWLAVDGDLAQVDLADRMNVEPPTLVKVLDCMEQAGLIERAGCPGDRRRKVVRPTAKAVPIWQRIIACANRVRDRSVRGLSTAQVEAAREILKQVHDNLAAETLSPQAEPAGCPDYRESPAATNRGGLRKSLRPDHRPQGVTRK